MRLTRFDSKVTWHRTGSAWGFNSDKGLDAFAADARNLNLPTTIDWFKGGDAEVALAKAVTTIEAEYRCCYAYHAQIEPVNAVASVSAAGDAAEVWCGTQYPTAALAAAARALGATTDKIKLNSCWAAASGGEASSIRNSLSMPCSWRRMRAGLDAAGKLTAWHQRVVGDRVLPFEDPPAFTTTTTATTS